jgi:hypothetical protein
MIVAVWNRCRPMLWSSGIPTSTARRVPISLQSISNLADGPGLWTRPELTDSVGSVVVGEPEGVE